MGAMNELLIDRMNEGKINITFFSRITADHWTAKNKLQAAAHELAYEMDRKRIPCDMLEDYISEFKRRIHELNSTHPRCKHLYFTWHKGYTRGWIEYWIYCEGVFQISLIEIKEDE